MRHPFVLLALSPSYAATLCLHHGLLAFVVLGSVVLCVTGAEALYADMGHFGREAIRIAWLFFVLPCLVLNYFGQGALLISEPSAAVQSVLPARPALDEPAHGHSRHGGDRDRQPGDDLRRLFRWRGNACSWASCRA